MKRIDVDAHGVVGVYATLDALDFIDEAEASLNAVGVDVGELHRGSIVAEIAELARYLMSGDEVGIQRVKHYNGDTAAHRIACLQSRPGDGTDEIA